MSLQASEDHRRQQLALRSVLLRELLRVWPALNVKRLDQTFPDWYQLVLQAVTEHRAYSSVVAQRYVDEIREAAGITEQWTPPPVRPVDEKRLELEMYRAAITSLKKAIAEKKAAQAARDTAFVVSAGDATKEALNGGRDVVLDSVEADRAAVGWYRITDGDPCYFCAMLASRGVWYKTQGSASFQPHGHCGCTAAPAYSRDVELQPVAMDAAKLYSASTKGFKGQDKRRAFRRAWEAAHGRS